MSRKVSTVISRCKKSAFVPFERVTENVMNLRWGKKDEVEKVGKVDEATGEYVLTGEVKETDYCTYEISRWYGELTAERFVSTILGVANRKPSMEELNVIASELGASDESKVKLLRNHLLGLNSIYGSSRDTVDRFSIDGHITWLYKDDRVGLKLRFDAELAEGKETTTLWDNGIGFSLPLVGEGNAFDLLNALELYASACYDNTQMHIANINALESVDELVGYDYMSGYPAMLEF